VTERQTDHPGGFWGEGTKPPSALGCDVVSSLSHCHILGHTSHSFPATRQQGEGDAGDLGMLQMDTSPFDVL